MKRIRALLVSNESQSIAPLERNTFAAWHITSKPTHDSQLRQSLMLQAVGWGTFRLDSSLLRARLASPRTDLDQ